MPLPAQTGRGFLVFHGEKSRRASTVLLLRGLMTAASRLAEPSGKWQLPRRKILFAKNGITYGQQHAVTTRYTLGYTIIALKFRVADCKQAQTSGDLIMQNRLSIQILLSLCSIVLAGCGDKTLFQAPPHGGDTLPPPTVSDSKLTLVATIPYSALVHAAEAKIPASVPIGGDGHVACLDLPYVNPGHVGSHRACTQVPYVDFRGAGMQEQCINVPDITGPSIGMKNQCADYHWNADINKDGPVRIANSGTDLHVEQNIHVTGKAGLGGDLAGALSLSGKNFDSKVKASMNLSVDLDNRWCPQIKVTPIGRWVDSASVEVAGKNCVGFDLGALGHPEVCAGPVNLGLADALNNEFDRHRDDIQRSAQSILPCDTLRAKVEEHWHPFSIKIDRSGAAPLFLNIEPKSAGFSGLIAEQNSLRMVVRVDAKTVVGASEIAQAASVLPQLEKVAAKEGTFDINLQAVAPYEFLKNELATQLKGKTFEQESSSSRIEVRIDDLDLYPSNGSLAVGLKVNAKLPGRWLNTAGWVYISGKPTPTEDGKAITVEGINFATVVDNEFWSVAQTLFETQILSSLKEHSKIDLSKQIDAAASEVTGAIAKANVPGLKISATPSLIKLSSVAMATDSLIATARLSMNADVELTDALLK
ncbi:MULTISPECIES: DUF4403 family protein [unclassified Bradyrhizobium]|uniref:DUF4403 family protein n=1 Tax=unclassified Bradyrhizobium TaxID=2631580 RepID=UPI0033933696